MCRTCGRIRPSKRCAGKWISSAATDKTRKNVGAGLLANAVDQSTHFVAATPRSRASPLPH
ncbi:hypothetical protein GIV23_18885 [Pseudomonas sp. PA-1-2A]|nr:hypothetical protein [Pseudomonas sp. PA-1-8C]MCF5787211.1 hypothetical protein [Pseudomonas sp. PA-1-6G]MCF5794447.1 hypothetical protein [Pseudomonas sp. PA-1-6B]MCF5799536.1 hypothetical protein [Pseudomonas sp. PA-1-5A]MCF5815376.1 hypothetical protein [Pseudomonas sp. PA-1-2A]MCF5835800.1 hypothetical protein [Pseudomonas sp. PA-1-6A]MCF8989894.1 hypothetical protein [Pseudomonas carnis]